MKLLRTFDGFSGQKKFLGGSDDERELLALIQEHLERTASPLAARLLADWPNARPHFVKVSP